MFKGVNHKIVEINQTGNDYFERAILFVNPEKADRPHKELTHWAEEYLEEVQPPSRKTNKLARAWKNLFWLKLLPIFVMGGFFGWFLFYLLS